MENIQLITSKICQYNDFLSPWYKKWSNILEPEGRKKIFEDHPAVKGYLPEHHRKIWEYAAVTEALWSRDMLRQGRKGIGFAVGQEPLPSLFASLGADITATDAPPEINGTLQDWQSTREYYTGLDSLYYEYLISKELFDKHVSFSYADMRNPLNFNKGEYDFVWSCCSMEHLGDLTKGVEFLFRSVELLKPGGIAVHTTEYNITSNDKTVSSGGNVIYRKQDVELIDRELRKFGWCLEEPDFRPGTHLYDRQYDIPPYFQDEKRQHIKLLLHGFVATSFIFIVLT